MAASVDVIDQTLGHFGKWQLRTTLIVFLCKIPTSWFMAVVIFTAPAPNPGDFWCKPPATLPAEFKQEWIQKAHPLVTTRHNVSEIDYCRVYRDIYYVPRKYFNRNVTTFTVSNLTTFKCREFEYAPGYESLVAKFSMLCGRAMLLPITQCFHIFGLLMGGIIAYYLLKIVSPRRVMLIGILCQIFFGILSGAVEIYVIHAILRCLSAFSCAFMYTSGTMILVDITGGIAKTIITILFELFWSIGLILLPVFYLFIRSPFGLYMGISTPTLLMVFLYRWLPDSPRWLLRHGRLDEAKAILLKGGSKNKRQIPDDIDNLLKQQADRMHHETLPVTWWSIWDGASKKRYLLACHYAWSAYILLYNSVVLNIRAYGRDHLQINTVAIAFSEIVGVFIGMYLVLYARRRWLWSGLMSITCGILAYSAWFIPHTLQETHVVALEMFPTMGIKLATSTGLCLLTVCTGQLVPIEKKGILMLSVTVWARGWFLWAPIIFMLKVYDTILPLTMFATLSVVGGILMCIVNHGLEIKPKRRQKLDATIQAIIAEDNVRWFDRFSKGSYDLKHAT